MILPSSGYVRKLAEINEMESSLAMLNGGGGDHNREVVSLPPLRR